MSNVIVQEALRGKVYRELPAKNLDGSDAYLRLGSRADGMVIPLTSTKHGLAEEGSYYTAANAAISTGLTIGGDTQTAWVATTPTLVIYNGAAAGGVNLIIDYLKLLVTSGGTAATQLEYAVLLDNINRYTSGGTALTPKNVNMGISTSSIASVYFGAITAPAASASVRKVARGVLRAAIPVAFDQYVIAFGASDISCNNSQIGSTTIINHTVSAPPAVIPPGSSLLVYTWGGSMSNSPEAEVEVNWWER